MMFYVTTNNFSIKFIADKIIKVEFLQPQQNVNNEIDKQNNGKKNNKITFLLEFSYDILQFIHKISDIDNRDYEQRN